VSRDASQADLLLASASPRRKELLERVGLRLLVLPAEIDETPRPDEPPGDYVRRMATEKLAAAVAATTTAVPASGSALAAALPLLAADTAVVVGGSSRAGAGGGASSILGKPRDEDDARAMLERLAGRRHEVITAYRIRMGQRELDRTVTTHVTFRLLDPGEIAAYLAGGEWRGKAGGYAVQGVAAAFVTELRGSLTNVVGLPLAEALADLRALGALPRYPPERFGPVA
jgi:septum formation protein